MIIRHSNGDINQSVQHKPTHDPNNGQFQNLRQSSLLRLPTAGYIITQNFNSKGLKERLIVILHIIESYERIYIWKKNGEITFRTECHFYHYV